MAISGQVFEQFIRVIAVMVQVPDKILTAGIKAVAVTDDTFDHRPELLLPVNFRAQHGCLEGNSGKHIPGFIVKIRGDVFTHAVELFRSLSDRFVQQTDLLVLQGLQRDPVLPDQPAGRPGRRPRKRDQGIHAQGIERTAQHGTDRRRQPGMHRPVIQEPEQSQVARYSQPAPFFIDPDRDQQVHVQDGHIWRIDQSRIGDQAVHDPVAGQRRYHHRYTVMAPEPDRNQYDQVKQVVDHIACDRFTHVMDEYGEQQHERKRDQRGADEHPQFLVLRMGFVIPDRYGHQIIDGLVKCHTAKLRLSPARPYIGAAKYRKLGDCWAHPRPLALCLNAYEKLLLFAMILAASFSACKKDQKNQGIEPAKGSISGVINPAGAVTGITASVPINGQPVTYHATADASGNYKFDGLAAGAYTIAFLPAANYVGSSRQITVTAGQHTDMGNITFSIGQGSISGTLSPAGLLTGLFMTYTSGGYTMKSLLANSLNSSGVMKADHLAAGTYTVSFEDVMGYITPAAQTIRVNAGQKTSRSTVTFEKAKPGSISGTVSPAGAAASITIAHLVPFVSGLIPDQTFSATPDGSGHFSLTRLDANYYYDITVNPVAGGTLKAPNKILVFLPTGQAIDLGVLALTAMLPPSPLSYAVNAAPFDIPLVFASKQGGSLTIVQPVATVGNILTLVIGNVTGVGDYTCNSSTGSAITLQTNSTSDIPPQWQSNAAGGDGLLKVTALDPVHQTISGTFTATVVFGANTKKFTNGAFVNVHFSKS